MSTVRSWVGADFVLTNVLGTQTLLQAALRPKLTKFVHVSTDEVYGSIDDGFVDETSRWSRTRRIRPPRRPPI